MATRSARFARPNDADSLASKTRERSSINPVQVNRLAENEMYILRPASQTAPFETEFVVMLQKKTFVGSLMTIPATKSRLIHRGVDDKITDKQ